MKFSIEFGRSEKKKTARHGGAAMRRSQFAASKVDRLTGAFSGFTASQDAMIFASLSRMRGRSRQLAADNDYARRFFKLCRSNVVGSQGIGLQVRAIERETKDGIEFDDTANRLIENGWWDWAKKKHCTIDGRLSLIDVLQLNVETAAKDGEIFVRKIKGKIDGNPYGFALQLIEADHVDENYNKVLANGNKIRMGIEFNKWNKPVAYHVLTKHPGDNFITSASRTEYERIPASEMVHLFTSERVSQSRGLPWILSAMRRFKMLGVYEENELVAAGVAASKMGFFKSEDGEGYTGTDKDEDGNLITEAEPGLFEQLPAGVDFVPWDPQHPTSSFPFFVKAMLRGGASGLGVSYNTLANDLEGVNFSSIRQGALEDRELWRLLQTWLIEHFLDDIFEDWLAMAMTTGKIPLPLTKFEKFNKPVWRPRGWSWVDPLKEVKSNREAMDGLIRSGQDVASEQGQDIEEVYAQLAREKKLRAKYGLTSTPSGKDEVQTQENEDPNADTAENTD